MTWLDEFYDDFPRVEEAFHAAVDESLQPRGPELLYDIVESCEWAEEHSGKSGWRLLYASRLIRDPERYIAQFGQAAYEIMLGDCLWHVYGMIGKLDRGVYVPEALGLAMSRSLTGVRRESDAAASSACSGAGAVDGRFLAFERHAHVTRRPAPGLRLWNERHAFASPSSHFR